MQITPKEAADIIKQLEIIHNLLEKVDNEKDCDEPLRLISLVINLLRHSNPSNFKRIKMVELLVLNYITDCSALNIWQLVQGCNIINAIIENIEDEFKL